MRIRAKHSGLALDVTSSSTAAGAQIIQWPWHGGDNQRFKVDALGGEREDRWRNPAIAALGHQGNWNGVSDYLNDLRRRLGTEWAYIGFFTKYPLGHFGYASIGGPRIVMDYHNDGWGPATSTGSSRTRPDTSSTVPTSTPPAGATAAERWGLLAHPQRQLREMRRGRRRRLPDAGEHLGDVRVDRLAPGVDHAVGTGARP